MVSAMGGRAEWECPGPITNVERPEIFALTAAGAPAGGLPRVRAAAQWSVSVATKDGAQMLKASTPTRS